MSVVSNLSLRRDGTLMRPKMLILAVAFCRDQRYTSMVRKDLKRIMNPKNGSTLTA